MIRFINFFLEIDMYLIKLEIKGRVFFLCNKILVYSIKMIFVKYFVFCLEYVLNFLKVCNSEN